MSKILIVDDSLDARILIKTRLEKHGYIIIEAENGQEALNILRRDKDIKIILLDYEMPDMDGISTFVRIKDEIDDYPPIIMVTGHGTVHLAVEFMKNGGKDFVPKPIDFDVLMLKIERVLDSVLKDNYIKELQREKTEMAILLNAAGALNHEINNPLNVIFQSIEHLQGKACDTHNIQRIKEAMVTIKEVVKNFNEIKQVKKKPYVAGIDILDIKKSAQ